MLAMAQKHYIKYLRDQKDLPITQIAEQLGINWRTAKKYADQSNWNENKLLKKQSKFPIMEPYREQVDTWLMEDKARPRKQRHTAKRIYDRLVEEYGFKGSERTVRYYVAKRKMELQIGEAEPYIRLEHPGGEAQVDFGTFQAVIGGKVVERKMLILSYPYSNAAFVFVSPRENTECFLEGLKYLFEQSGGVPKRIWFDNLATAVVSIKKDGKRVLTREFEKFSLHYRFTPVFCNPGKGNEKGNVENKVGYIRRNWCVPLPSARNLKELQSYFNLKALEDLEKTHYSKGTRQLELCLNEKDKLLELPLVPYEVFRLENVKANGYGEIVVDQKRVKVPTIHAGETLWVRVWWDRIDIIDQQYTLVMTLPRVYEEDPTSIDLSVHLKPFLRKPKALSYSSVLAFLPDKTKAFLLSSEGKQRKTRVDWLIRMLKTYNIDEIEKGLLHSELEETEQLEHVLYKLRHPEFRPLPFLETRTPAILRGRKPDLSRYDRLQQWRAQK